MKFNFLKSIQTIENVFLKTKGDTSFDLRKAIWKQAESLTQINNKVAIIPDHIRPYLEKVAFHADKITDDDIRQIKEAGYSEEEIFEMTLAATLGAAVGRVNQGIKAMKEE